MHPDRATLARYIGEGRLDELVRYCCQEASATARILAVTPDFAGLSDARRAALMLEKAAGELTRTAALIRRLYPEPPAEPG